MHSNFKTIFRNYVSLGTTEQNLPSIRPVTSMLGTEITNSLSAVFHSSQGNSNPFRGIIHPFRDILRDELWIVN